MIACFPDLYPDELVYSLLARIYVRNGYMAYRYCAEDLFMNRTAKPDIEFINNLTPEARNKLTAHMSIGKIVACHTMFPYYGKFLPLEKRKQAFCALTSMSGSYYNLLPLPKTKGDQSHYLRYCPMCTVEDRKQHGETYWHRNHQLTGVNVCPLRC